MLLVILANFLRMILIFTRPFSTFILDTLYRIILGKSKPLPPIRNRILLLSATKLAECIRKKKLTAEEVMRAYIDRIKEVDPIIRACVDNRFEAALDDAKVVDRMLETGVKTEREIAEDMPLLGVPFSCKEMIGVEGLSQTNGLLFCRNRKSPSNAEVVLHYKKAGAIPVVVTNVPTISMWWETSNLVYGRTYNPYDHRRTVGGSSGGEAAILTSAGSVIGIGTDIGGSIRIPSCFCGIYGHKPSRGVISNQRPWPNENMKYEPFRTTGPMCRYIEDLKLLFRILCGEQAKRLRLDDEVDFRRVKIYFMEEFPGYLFSSTSDVKAAVRKAVKHFEENFSNRATKLQLEEMRHAFFIWQLKFLEVDDEPPLRKELTALTTQKKVNWYWELLKSLFGFSNLDLPIVFFASIEKENKDEYYYKCLQAFQDLRLKLEEVLAGDAILLLPTQPEPAPHIGTTIPKVENVGYTSIFNILGYPVTNIPAGMSQGVPIGLQAVAALNHDRLTLATAVELDKAFKGWRSPCMIDA